MESIKLDFCIIENPLNVKRRPIIFVTRNNLDELDETIVNEGDYEKAIFAIQNLGYIESDLLTFESSEDPDFPALDISTLKKKLEKKGMRYNQVLETTLKDTLNSLQDADLEVKKNDIIYTSEYPYPGLGRYVLNLSKPKNNVPEFGEKITFYFYLFLEAEFTSKTRLFVTFAGDIESKVRDNRRNYIRPVKVDFIRVKNKFNLNKILFKSEQTFQDLFKMLPLTGEGSFVYVGAQQANEIGEQEIKSFSLVFDFMDIKNNLKLQERITLESENNVSYDRLLGSSSQVKQDYINYERKIIPITQKLVDRLYKITATNDKKMTAYADEEKFEKAAILKRDNDYILYKISKLKEIQGTEMRLFNYIKKFHLK